MTRGGLGTLRSTGGDFAVASDSCLVNDTGSTFVSDPGVPSPGDGFWYVVRGTSCVGGGTYDEGGAQVGSRDAEIDAAPAGCP